MYSDVFWDSTWSISRKCIRNAICFAATLWSSTQVLGQVRKTHKLGFQNWRKVIHWIMSGRPALDINKLMEARPFSTSHSLPSRRWSSRSQSGSSSIMGAVHYDHSRLAGYRSKRSTATGTVKWWYIIVTIIAWLRGRWSIWVLRRSTASLADCNHRL